MRRGLRTLADCAPIDGERSKDRRMRAAVTEAKRGQGFDAQQEFDRALARLVRATPVPPEIAEWFANEKLAQGTRRGWKSIFLHPAIWAVAIALAVIAFIGWLKFDEQIHTFAGESVAKRLLAVASSVKVSDFEPVQAQAGTMGDFFLMKYRLNHYEVPSEFARLKTIGARVFDDEEAGKVAHIGVEEKRMQLFLFPEAAKTASEKPTEQTEWNYVEQEGWTGAVRSREGMIFMAAVRGSKKDLTPYLRGEAAR